MAHNSAWARCREAVDFPRIIIAIHAAGGVSLRPSSYHHSRQYVSLSPRIAVQHSTALILILRIASTEHRSTSVSTHHNARRGFIADGYLSVVIRVANVDRCALGTGSITLWIERIQPG